MFNNSNLNFSTLTLDGEEGQAFRLALVLVNLLIQILGTPLILGVIFYEHFGSDPQKRTVLNQLLSGLCVWTFPACLIPLNVINYRLMVGPVSPMMANALFFFVRNAMVMSCLLTMDMMVIIRYLAVFVWKKVLPISDGFFFKFLFALNSLVGLCYGIWGIMGCNVEVRFLYLLTGVAFSPNCQPIFRFYRVIFFASILIHLVGGVRFGIKKAMDYRKKRVQICHLHQAAIVLDTFSPVTEPQAPQPPQGNGYNTTARNVDLSNTLASVVILGVFTLLNVYIFEDSQSPWSPIINILSVIGMAYLLAPAIFWISHPDIGRFIWSYFTA